MPSIRFLALMRPIMGLLPEVADPVRKPIFRDKIVWTGVTLFIYLICCQIPLYGVYRTSGADPLYWMRVILASNKGTLMELGISPIITSGMIMQLLAGTKIIDVNYSIREDKILFKGVQKLLSLIICVCEAFAYVWSGVYGDINALGVGNAMFIIFQLVFAGVIVIMLDEMMQKGYGLGSGISLFIATNICENIFWRAFSPITLKTEAGTQFEGAFISLFHLLATKSNKFNALYQAFYRTGPPNLNNFVATFLVFLFVIYAQGWKIDIPLVSNKMRGIRHQYPIKLFYTSNTPIILQTALVSNLYLISQVLYRKYRTNFLVRILGQWQDVEMGGHSIPIGGFAYYISPPKELADFIRDPLHAVAYLAFVMFSCAMFSKFWIEISGASAKEVAKQLVEQEMSIVGKRDSSIIKELNRYIPTAAALGGMIIGLLTIVADFMGAIGSGTGLLLAVNIIYEYFEMYKKEKKNYQF